MKTREALQIAKQVWSSVTLHRGNTRADRAIQIYGCSAHDGADIAGKINGTVRQGAGYCFVWF